MKRVVAGTFLLFAGASLLTPSAALASDDRSVDELRQRVAELEAQVAEMGSKDAGWMTEQRADEIRSLVRDVIADADTRASLLNASGLSYNDGFVFRSQDGDMEVAMSGQLQVRWVGNVQDDSADDSTRYGVENRRTKINWSGNVYEWGFEVTGAFDRSGGSFGLEDAIIEREVADGVTLAFGQYKPPFMREELVSSKRQLAVDRSLVNEAFNQDRSQGVMLSVDASDNVRFAASIDDGFGNDSTAALAEDTEFSISGRGEIMLDGGWRQFRDFTSAPGSDPGVMLGVAGHYQKDEYGTASGPEIEQFAFTADASIELDGANIFGAVVWQSLDDDAAVDFDQWGFVIQGGLYVTDDTELFGRFEWGDDDFSEDDLTVVTIGVNKYYHSHSVKLSGDVGYAFENVSSFWDSSGVGWREDPADEDGQLVLRAQLQLLW